jgi:hypothetical protein
VRTRITSAQQLPTKVFADEETLLEGTRYMPKRKAPKVHKDTSNLESCESDGDCEKGERCIDQSDDGDSDASGKCMKIKDIPANKRHKHHSGSKFAAFNANVLAEKCTSDRDCSDS